MNAANEMNKYDITSFVNLLIPVGSLIIVALSELNFKNSVWEANLAQKVTWHIKSKYISVDLTFLEKSPDCQLQQRNFS